MVFVIRDLSGAQQLLGHRLDAPRLALDVGYESRSDGIVGARTRRSDRCAQLIRAVGARNHATTAGFQRFGLLVLFTGNTMTSLPA